MKAILFYVVLFVMLLTQFAEATEKRFGSSNFGFIENKGQFRYTDGSRADDILYMFSGNNMKIYIKRNSVSYEVYNIKENRINSRKKRVGGLVEPEDEIARKRIIHSHRIDVDFEGASNHASIFAEGCSNEYYNFYCPDGKEVFEARKYKKIIVEDLYPGIDIVYYLDEQHSAKKKKEYKFKYDFIVHPNADLEQLKLLYKGANNLTLTESGNLLIETSEGMITEGIPLSYELEANNKPSKLQNVNCYYNLSKTAVDGENKVYEIEFNLNERDLSKTLIIDPELFWGTYYGGEEYDYFTDIALDSKDDIYAVGYTESTTLIATTGAHQTTYSGYWDAVLAKFNNQGRLIWATYYAGSQYDLGMSVVVNYEDDVFIAGYTNSTSGIATAGSYQSSYGGGVSDGFIAKFNPSGVRQWGTYYGDEEVDVIYSMALDSNKNLIIGGRTQSFENIASSNGLQTYKEGLIDGFVVKFDSAMNRVWGTYIGGNESGGTETVTAVAADRAGNVMIVGFTPCDYSITNDKGFQPDFGGKYDAYILKLYPSGSMHWGSYYGGSDDDFGRAVATYGNGNIYLVGTTKSYNNIASNGAHQETFSGVRDAFVVKFDTYGDRKWGTYYGGSEDDLGIAVSKYGFDECLVLGHTLSDANIATSGEVQTSRAGLEDIFAVRFNTQGVRKWGTYYGGIETELTDYGGIGYDKKGNVIIAGTTQSGSGISTPATNPHQPDFVGGLIIGENPETGELDTNYKNDAFMIMIGTRITINNFAAEYCQSSTISVPFTVGLDFNAGNVFTLQLSDETGDFTSPRNIGTLTSYTSGWITGTIPADVEPGAGFRVRIVASNPANTSDNNGFDITINPLPEPDILGETPVCSRNTYVYQSADAAGYDYIWTITNGQFLSDSATSVIQVKWDDKSFGNLKLVQTNSTTGCVDSTEKNIEIIIAPDVFITGETTVTPNSEENYSTISNSKYNYEWTASGGTIVGTDNTHRIVVTWGVPGIGSVHLKTTDSQTNCHDTTMINVIINASPLTILGKKKVCASSNEQYSVETPPTSKNLWSVSGGQIVGSNRDSALNVLWSSAPEGFIQLIQTDTASMEIDTVVQRIEIIPAPKIGFFGINEFCEGDIATYIVETSENRISKWSVYNAEIIGSDNKDTIMVKWNNISSTEDSLFVKGSVTLMQTDLTTGCSNSKTIITSIAKNPSAEFYGNTNVCAWRVETYSVKDENTLSNKWMVSGGTIIGTDNDTTLQVEWWAPPTVGKIKLFQTSITACFDSSETEILIRPVPERPFITASGKDLISSSEEGNQWFYNSEKIEGANYKTFTPNKTGYYTVQVTNAEGCASDISQPYYLEISKVVDKKLHELGIEVYPNPADNILNIDMYGSDYINLKIKIFNALGVTYYFNNSIDVKNLKIDISTYPSGFYILEIQKGTNIYYEKLVIE